MKKTSEFLSAVENKVCFREAHSEIRKELSRHIDDLVAEGRDAGLSEENATNSALNRMGSPSEIGEQLNQVHTPKTPWLLIAVATALLLLGIFHIAGFQRLGSHSINIAMGLGIGFLMVWLRPSQWMKWSGWIFGSAIAFLGAAVAWGESYQGMPYLAISCFNIDAVNFSMAPLLLGFVGILGQRNSSSRNALFAIIPVILFSLLGSPYAAMCFSVAALATMLAVGTSTTYVFSFLAMSAVALGSILSSQLFLSGESFAQARTAEAHTDFALSHLHEMSSVLGALGIFLSMALLAQLGTALTQVKSTWARAALAGHLGWVSIGILWSILANAGFVAMPNTGSPLPLVSYGGSLLVGHLTMLGLSVGMIRRRSLVH